MRDFREQNYYELLDLKPYASQQEVEEAYQRSRRYFSPDSVATYALFQVEELRLLRSRIEEAFRVLGDIEKRRQYDEGASHIGEGRAQEFEKPEQLTLSEERNLKEEKEEAPAAEEKEETPDAEEKEETPDAEEKEETPDAEEAAVPELPVLDENTEYTGEILAQVREVKGVSLEEIAEITKISIYYLRCIEAETFEELPAPVYTRGYLRQVARILGLDGERVAVSYLERIKRSKD